ncbi:ABC transporter ATP-binding protein [Amaricoccus tamworthensis]|uniref:iron ABC transporter ATP-binding protein n=1 Tax=Amaricoccus tamworthensis TaxID=57002 RepID=UPI003C79FEB2
MIEVDRLSHSIGGSGILKDVTTSIPAGGITAIIGPNGAGKSTLLNLIARQSPIESGRITVDGLDVSTTDTRQLALKMAYVAQNTGVASRLRVAELVGFGRWPHCHGRPTQADREAVTEALALFSLDGLENRFLDELSGGQKQRAFIAMAHAQATDWLLLDEPLNNLDMFHARKLMRDLDTLSRELNRSVVMVVHEINYACAWADHVIGMRDGRVVIEGPVEDVVTEVGMRTLYDLDAHVTEIDGHRHVLHHV